MNQKVLIESDWNLKEDSGTHSDFRLRRINRIRLEFKGNYLASFLKKQHSINRIRLEFKGQCRVQGFKRCLVLIESDWNLKMHSSSKDLIGLSSY